MHGSSNNPNDFRSISQILPKLFANSHIVLFRWEVSEKWTVKYASENCFKIYGYTAEDFYTKSKLYEKIVHPDYIDRVLNEIEKNISAKVESYRHNPYKIITKTNQVKWVDDFTQIEYDESGNAVFLNGFIIDITNKIETDKQLEILTKGIEHSPATVVVTDIEGKVNYVNQKFKDLTGYSFEEVKNKKLNFIQSGKHDKDFYKNMWETILSGESWKGEICNKKKNGEFFWEYLTITPIKNSKKEITHFLGIKEDITQRKKIENELRESQSNFSSLINNSLQSFTLIGRDRKILAFNNKSALNAELIYNKQMKIGDFIDEYVLEKDKENFDKDFDRCLQGENFIIEKSFQVLDKELTFAFNYNPVKNSNGYVTAVSFGVLELTELRQTSITLQSTLEKLNLALETANLSWWEWDIKTGQIFADSKRNTTLGYPNKIAPKDYNSVLELIHPDDRAKTIKALDDYLNGISKYYDIEFRLKNSIGDYVWFHDTGKVSAKDENGVPSKIIGIIQNIDQKKKAEQAKELILEEYERVVSSIPINIWKTTFDKNGNVITNYFSPIINNLTEIEPPDKIGNSFERYISFIKEEDRDKFFQIIKEGIKKSFHKIDVEYRLITPKGEVKFVRSRGMFKKINEDLFEAYGYKEDISSEIKNRAIILENEKRLKSLIDTIPDLLFVLDKNGKYLDVHSPKDELLVADKENLIGKNIDEFLEKELVELFLKNIKNTLQDEILSHFEYSLNVSKEEKIFDARIVKNSEDSVLVVVRDITEKKYHEDNLQIAKEEAEKSNRLKSEFLAQMSHEIRTPINAMLSFTSLLKEELIETIEEDLKESFDIIANAGNRLIRTIDLILDMSDVQAGSYDYRPQEIHLHEILKSLQTEFSITAKTKGLELKSDLKAKDFVLTVDEYTVKQIFANLIDNAIKYTKAGYVEIKTHRTEENIIVEIVDTGIGISEGNQSVIFEPFRQEDQGYSRKFEGNGLGLALVKNYCEMNNATIEVESKKDIGSIFRVTFKK